MRIPARFAPLLFGALLSAIMVSLVSAFVLLINQGLHADFLAGGLHRRHAGGALGPSGRRETDSLIPSRMKAAAFRPRVAPAPPSGAPATPSAGKRTPDPPR
jgi:hypothetical protein